MFEHIFNSVWTWFGLGGVAIAICLAVAWYMPPFRKLALTIAGGIAAFLTIYGKGVRDASARKQKQWDKAEDKSTKRGIEARKKAETDVKRGGKDKFDREDI